LKSLYFFQVLVFGPGLRPGFGCGFLRTSAATSGRTASNRLNGAHLFLAIALLLDRVRPLLHMLNTGNGFLPGFRAEPPQG
jgi:hypothetical protein